MEKVNYNIEFAHIYSDEKIGEEQLKSAEVVKNLVKKLNKQSKTYTLCVLIDEYHPVYSNFDLDKFLTHFKKMGIPPAYIGYEGELIPAARLLLKQIPEEFLISKKMHTKLKFVKEIISLKTNNKWMKLKELPVVKFQENYTCVLLSAAWSLLRLGLIQSKHAVRITGLTDSNPFPGENLITVLPKKYEPVERRALEIIKSTPFESYIKNMKHIFF